MKNILVAVDFEKNTKLLLDHAASLAKKFDSKIRIIHIAAPDPEYVGYDAGPQYIRDNRAEDLREEHKILQQYADDLKKNGIHAEALLVQGPTVKMILEEAEKLKIDLIIIGSHEHSFLYKAFLGDTTSGILRKSKIPFLVIPIE